MAHAVTSDLNSLVWHVYWHPDPKVQSLQSLHLSPTPSLFPRVFKLGNASVALNSSYFLGLAKSFPCLILFISTSKSEWWCSAISPSSSPPQTWQTPAYTSVASLLGASPYPVSILSSCASAPPCSYVCDASDVICPINYQLAMVDHHCITSALYRVGQIMHTQSFY